MPLIKLLAIIFVLFAMSRVYLRFKDKSLTGISLISWLILWAGVLVLTLHPQLSDIAASFLGVQRGTDIAFLVAIIILFYLVFRLYTKVDSVDQNLTKMNTNVSKLLHKISKQDAGSSRPN